MNLFYGVLFFLLGQTVIWFTTNAQFLSEYAAKKPWLMTLIAAPVTYLFILATKYCASAFDGLLWPGRFIGFATGMIVFALATTYYMKEPFSAKILISLALATILVTVQIFWK
tara:strand:+ start:128 stop:466 length:339 start_codon:yes stop_codon:yes gene_type:complete